MSEVTACANLVDCADGEFSRRERFWGINNTKHTESSNRSENTLFSFQHSLLFTQKHVANTATVLNKVKQTRHSASLTAIHNDF
jgi:hypothetical protein